MTKYCVNCESEATHIVVGELLPLCYTCHTAYQWGQNNPNAHLMDVEQFYSSLNYITAKYISPADIAIYNNPVELPAEFHIPINASVSTKEWSDCDGLALVVPESSDCEVWVLQSWLRKVS